MGRGTPRRRSSTLAPMKLHVIDGTYELFGATDPAGNEIGIRTGYFFYVVEKSGDSWKVSASRLMLPTSLIWRAR